MTGGRMSFGACILTETFYPLTGGGETQARILADGLTARGLVVNLVTRRSDAALPRRENLEGVRIHRTPPAGPGHLRKWGMLLPAFIALLKLRREYDVILVCGFRLLGVPALLAGVVLRRPCVLKADSQGELSGSFFDAGLRRLGMRSDRIPFSLLVRARNVLLRRADRFVAISAVIEREYLGAGVPADRIVRIPNSVDIARFHPVSRAERGALRARLDIAGNRCVAVFTGRLVTTKGLHSLLRAWPVVLESHPRALLMLVGSGGLGLQNCEESLRRHVREHGLGRDVRFTGAVEQVQPYLQASDAFVLPTEREAFGISVIEAMACGLPVVTTGVDGIADVVRPEVDALVVPPGDDDALASAIVRALDGGEEMERIAGRARARALQCWSNERVIAAYADLLAEVREK